VHVRVAGHEGKLYLDLADAGWRAVEIDTDGWRVVSSPPVRFRRAPGMLPLPEPMPGGSIEALRPLLNVEGETDFVLAVAWLLGALRDTGPYPALVLSGEQGSAKSTFCSLLRALIDPNAAPLRALPREDRDLFIAASNGHVLAFDNVSGLPAWISDTLCRLATGGGFSTRELYSDDAEKLFDAMRPAIINGIEDIAVRPDLADRAITLMLEPIMEATRRPEKELRDALHRERPRILGALLDAVAHGLRRLPDVKLEKLPRMADFMLWVASCETALWPTGTFAAAYRANREEAVDATVEADLVSSAVRSLMANRMSSWEGTASQLLDTLGLLVTEPQRRSKTWPTTAHHLSGRLRRAAPGLRKIGIVVERTRTMVSRHIRVTRAVPPPEEEGNPASSASAASCASHINALDRTLTGEPASDAADAVEAPDAQGQPSVSCKPLKDQPSDAADAHDAHLRSLSGSPEGNHSCRQCNGELDGTEQLYRIDDKPVWLHPECHRHYRGRVYR
jgi:hypothetical protein